MNGNRSSSVAVESAKKVCTRVHQAYRDTRLYPPGHPAVSNTIQMLEAAVKSHLDTLGRLALTVGEDRLFYEGEEVYTHAESRDNLAFLMFRDGIRALTLDPGLEPREIAVLVELLAQADQMSDTGHDLSTSLWERDLVHVGVEMVDPFLEGEGTQDDAYDELRETVMRRLSELGASDAAESGGGGGDFAPDATGAEFTASGKEDADKVDVNTVALTEEDLERGEWLVSHASEPIDEFALVLLDIMLDPSLLGGGDEPVARSLSLVVGQYLDRHDLDGLDTVLDRLVTLESKGHCPRGTMERVFADAATAERLSALIAAASVKSAEKAASIGEFLARMRGSLYPALLEIMATSSDKTVRKAVLDLLHTEGGIPVRYLWPLMKDPRWYVVRNAVQLATATGDPGLASQLEPLSRHPDARVRREVVRSLATIGEARCLPALVRALQDEDSAVRTLAVRGLARQGNKAHFPAVQAMVEARDFEDRPPEEVEAILVAFAALGGERTVEVLNRMWKHRVFGTRSLPLRLASVQALGAVGSPEASRALSEAVECGEAQLQRVAARALAEMQARAKGASA
jgi:HEAT repeat protein